MCGWQSVHCHLFDIISVADLLSEVICHLYFLLLFLTIAL